MTVTAVVFDLDGVLVDSEPVWHEVEIEVYTALGCTVRPADLLAVTGLRSDEAVAYFAATQPWSGPSQVEVAERILDGMVRRLAACAEPAPGASRAVELAASAGARLAVASSSPIRLIDTVLERFGIRDRFDVVVSAHDEPRGKPDPAVYQTAARRLGVAPVCCTAIEDSPNGARAAVAAGMRCIGVPVPEHRDAVAGVAHVVLGSLADLELHHLAP